MKKANICLIIPSMRPRLKPLFIGLFFLPLPTLSFALPVSVENLQPYAALEYVERSIFMENGYGRGNFTKRLPQESFALGVKLNDFIGLEAGYSASQSMTRTSLTGPGETYLGIFQDPGEFKIFENKIRLNSLRINLMGYLPLTNTIHGIMSAGISSLQLKAVVKPIGNEGDPHLPPAVSAAKTRHFSSRKLNFLLMGGVGYQFSNTFGIRILIGYETTSRFKNVAPKEDSNLRLKLKNNILCTVGITSRF